MELCDKLEVKFRLDINQKKALHKLKLFSVYDLLFHFPVRYSELSEAKQIAELIPGEIATVYGKISKLKTKKSFRSKIPMGEGEIEDLSGKIKIIWFHQAYLAKMIHEGESVKLTGKVTQGKNGIYLANPEFEKTPDMPINSHDTLFFAKDGKNSSSVFSFPIYHETRDITSKWFYHAIEKILKDKTLDNIEDYIPADILKKYNLPSLKTALIWIHKPKNQKDAEAARKRFAFEEVFCIQLERQHDKFEYRKNKSFQILPDKKEVEEFLERFPFEPTNSQKKSIETILSDMAKNFPMSRLLEGDVGSGKTAVAATAAYAVTQMKTQTDRTQIDADDKTQTNETFLYKDLTYTIRNIAFTVHNELGPGHKEAVYQNAFEEELNNRKISFSREKRIDVFYRNKKVGTYQPDFVIDDKVIVEFKSLPFIGPKEKKQMWNYIKGSSYKLALLINFGNQKVDIIRVVYDIARNEHKLSASSSALNQRVSAPLQVAYMAPTEILATQHFESFIQYFKHLPINIGLITGSGCRKFPSKVNPSGWTDISRAQLLKWTANGEIPILIGTHALIQKTVKFKNLAFVVIDEQHRFGTGQRRKLVRKDGVAPHLLSMTATPIPRTLALTIYGDLDLSLLDEMPTGRKQIITEIITPDKREETYEKIREEIKKGRQLYVICPRIEEPNPEKEMAVQAKSAVAEAKKLKKEIFREYEIGVLHSKISKQKKEQVMKNFTEGKLNILCATSVVEVGVNVPNATVIIIEGAERFGLAQLHQLRGRVIRSNHQAYCYVFADAKSQKTIDRLKALKTAKNGFELAELDLSLRGAGELGGTKQWGITDLGMEAIKNMKMVEAARAEAIRLISEDPELFKYPLLKQKVREKVSEFHFE